MKVLVCIKRVADYKTEVRIKSDNSGIDLSHVKMMMNPFDEIAVEEAVRLKEKGIVTDITVVSIGKTSSQEILRSALALGADQAILVETEQTISPLSVAKILEAIVLREKPQLVLLGKQAIDEDNNQTGQMLAGLLHWAQGTFISMIEVIDTNVRVTREIDGGTETLLLKLPAVITTDLRLNEPRYLSLPNIMQAKKKNLQIVPLAELNLSLHSELHLLEVVAPQVRRAGVKLASIPELIDKLRDQLQGML